MTQFRSRGHGSSRTAYPLHQGQRRPRHHASQTLTYAQRERLPDRDFAVILKDGTRKYPIENEAHARNALARVAQHGNPEEKAEVRRKVHERYPNIASKYDIGEEVIVDGKNKGRITYIRWDAEGKEEPKYRVKEEGENPRYGHYETYHYMSESRLSKV